MDVVSYIIGYQGGLKKGSEQGVELPELENPAGAAQIREGYEAIDANGAKIEGEMPTVEMYIDSLSFDKTNGKIIAGATVTGSGYVQQIRKTQNASVSTLGATTIIPGAEDQVIEKHRWLTGDITVKAASLDLPDLDNPAAAADIRAGYEVVDENGEVVVGTMPKAAITVGEPSIDSDGRITASVAYTEGYIEKAGGTIAMNSTVKTAEPNTYYAGVGDRVIEAGTYLKGDIVIKGVALQEKTVTPGEADIVVTPDADYTGLSKVTVEAVTGGGGGGSMEGVHTVTFMSHDGTTELYKRPVADGDDCADPVTRGYISAPTKASTAQYNFSFVGWATTPNGAWDTNALKAVTADKTVYAAFASVTRYYTITYYDDDGTTVLKTESLAYGTMPSYAPSKEGYMFAGWEPDVSAVIGAASYTAQFSEKLTFAGASWAEIARIAEAGEAAQHFAVGDTKTIPLNFSDGTTENLLVRIVGLNHDNLADGSGKAGISIMCAEAIDHSCVEVAENVSSGNSVTWVNSQTRALFNSGEIWNALPSELQAVIKTVTKTSNYASNNKGTTEDKVWMPSSTELGLDGFLSSSYVASGQGSQYQYCTTDSKRIVKKANGAAVEYATRSLYTYYQYYSVLIKTSGAYEYGKIGKNGGYGTQNTKVFPRVLGFCI